MKLINLWLIWYSTAFVFYGLNYNFIITLKKLNLHIQNDGPIKEIVKASLTQILVPFTAILIHKLNGNMGRKNIILA